MQVRQHYKKAATLLLGASLALGGLWGCSSGGGSTSSGSSLNSLPSAVAAAARSAAPVSSALVDTNNAFGFQLFSQLRKTDAGSNVFISPTSVALAFQIVYNGAQGPTQTAMAQALGVQGMSVADLNNANAALQASLYNPDSTLQLTIANSLWYYKSQGSVTPAFLQTNANYYGSALRDLSGAPDNVNAWVSNATNGKIPQVVQASDLQGLVALIVNTVYFKGPWTTPFDPTQTSAAPFTLANGSQVTAQMMHQTGVFDYFKGDHFQAVRLPYGQKRISMIVLLPDAGTSLDSVLGELNTATWNTWMTQFTAQYGAIGLPRFKTQYTANLVTPLTSLGMGIAFTRDQADFSALASVSHLYITKATHQSYLAVDEQGTEAAGATTIGVGVTSVGLPSFTMTMEHPFVCVIRDDKTGDLLFVGAIDKVSN